MVGSWRLLSAGINTKERPAAMSKMFLVDKKSWNAAINLRKQVEKKFYKKLRKVLKQFLSGKEVSKS